MADDDNDDDDDDGCGSESESDTVQPFEHAALSTTTSSGSHTTGFRTPYRNLPILYPSPSQSHQSGTPTIVGTLVGIAIALVAFSVTARYIVRRRPISPSNDPAKPRFVAFRPRSKASKKRLSDESWVSPALPAFGSPVSPLSQDLDLRQYGLPQRKLVPVTTPVCTPTDTEFGIRAESEDGSVIPVPPVRVPSPVYISPFSPSPSPSLTSASSLSPAPSTEPLSSPSPEPARLSRLLSSTFRVSRVSPARPTTAHLIHTARACAHAYRPSSATTTSLYTQPTPSARLSGARSRTSFYPGQTDDAWARVRDTFSTVTTSDTVCTVPHLLHAVTEARPSVSPFADAHPENRNQRPASATSSMLSTIMEEQVMEVGTSLGQKLRLSDASEHARYRMRERERQQERERRQRVSIDSSAVYQESLELDVEEVSMTTEFKLRDSERVLREIGW